MGIPTFININNLNIGVCIISAIIFIINTKIKLNPIYLIILSGILGVIIL